MCERARIERTLQQLRISTTYSFYGELRSRGGQTNAASVMFSLLSDRTDVNYMKLRGPSNVQA